MTTFAFAAMLLAPSFSVHAMEEDNPMSKAFRQKLFAQKEELNLQVNESCEQLLSISIMALLPERPLSEQSKNYTIILTNKALIDDKHNRMHTLPTAGNQIYRG